MIKHVGLLAVIIFGAIGCQQTKLPEEEPLDMVADAVPDHAWETLDTVVSAEPPPAILADLAARLTDADLTPPEPPNNKEGDTETFWYLSGTVNNDQIEATLQHQSALLNMWMADGAKVSDARLLEAADKLEDELLLQTRSLFGTEAQPGIDGDSRLNILHLPTIGRTGGNEAAAGYFNGADRLPKSVNEFSNEREMIYIALDMSKVGSDKYFSTIIHELEHLIHDSVDHNEFAWVDEGFAELANAVINQTTPETNISRFAQSPDTQLNDWPRVEDASLASYGASYLFNQYMLDRFGEEATKQVVQNGDNGFRGYGNMLAQYGMGVDQFFGDWAVTNYLTSIGRETAPYAYEAVAMDAVTAETIKAAETLNGTVNQYGTDYIKIDSDETVTVQFTGSTQVSLLDVEPHSGAHFWTTYPADRSDMSLTKRFDLTATDSPTVTLQFWTWYEIEAGWDYGYVLVSTDGGDKWEMQADPFYATAADPHGSNFGFAYTGHSLDFRGTSPTGSPAEWVQININLNDYIGQEILVRFEYVTDQAVFEAGWAIDDITIPEIGYSEDFESGDGDWIGAGWMHHTNTLPQLYLIQAVYLSADEVRVEPLTLEADQTAEFEIDPAGGEVVLTVAGITPVTTQRTAYQIDVK